MKVTEKGNNSFNQKNQNWFTLFFLTCTTKKSTYAEEGRLKGDCLSAGNLFAVTVDQVLQVNHAGANLAVV